VALEHSILQQIIFLIRWFSTIRVQVSWKIILIGNTDVLQGSCKENNLNWQHRRITEFLREILIGNMYSYKQHNFNRQHRRIIEFIQRKQLILIGNTDVLLNFEFSTSKIYNKLNKETKISLYELVIFNNTFALSLEKSGYYRLTKCFRCSI